MIYAYTGKTGSGKTFRMVKHAYSFWLNGTDIYSNTFLLFEEQDKKKILTKLYRLIFRRAPRRGKIIYFEDISEILEAREGLILFDEAQVLFNARQWESLPEEFQWKLQQSRKHKLDLFCTTQNMGAIDITYRRLVQFWYHHKRVFQIGKNKSIFGLYTWDKKDVDELYNSVDDLTVTTEKWRPFFIHLLSQTLYDTFYDIGFRRFKILWLSIINPETNKLQKEYFIIPKRLSLKNAQSAIYTLKSNFGMIRSGRSSSGSKSFATNF